ncbi:MAG: restriction endonuclease subunit S, partial [Bacteroidetes bacterium]
AEINPRRPRIERDDDTLTSFVPMAAVDEVRGEFSRIEIKPYREVKRGFTYFEENDVVFAKITPSMQNGKSAVARKLIDGFGFGTTEFHVIRAKGTVLPEWIHQFVRQRHFLLEAMKHFRGAVGQQRVPAEFLANYQIPVPHPNDPQKSLVIQQQILEQMKTVQEEVWEMIDDLKAEQTLLDNLEQAVLAQAFRGEL